MLEEKILNIPFYKKYKKIIRVVYKQKSLQERYRIKRAIYHSKLSGKKKDEIWAYLNRNIEDKL